jgi:hypothetical protein
MRFWRIFAGATRFAPQILARIANDESADDARAGLTSRQCACSFCFDPEQAPPFFINSKPRRGLLPRR